MQVIYHIGAHNTDEDRLVRCLLKNKGALAAEGIIVPGPSRYRAMLRDTVNALRGSEASPEAQAVILDAVMEEDSATRLILSNEQFLCLPDKILGEGRLYPFAGKRVRSLANLFPKSPMAFHLGIRNPATFLPAVLGRMPDVSYQAFVAGSDLLGLRWSDTIRRIVASVPACPLTVWCNEDTPLLWPEIVANITQHDPDTPMDGLYDLVSEIMSPEGNKWMLSYLASHPPQTALQRRRIVAAFLAKFSLADKIEMELDLPGWTNELVEEMTDRYEEDIADIQKMSDITFLSL